MDKKAYKSRELTKHLRELAADIHDMTAEGDVLTKGQALARLLFQKALGYTEKKIDDEGKESLVVHKPEAWAIQLIYDRIEGKIPQAVVEDETRVKAAERVRELATQRINAVTSSLLAFDRKPPSYRKRKGKK